MRRKLTSYEKAIKELDAYRKQAPGAKKINLIKFNFTKVLSRDYKNIINYSTLKSLFDNIRLDYRAKINGKDTRYFCIYTGIGDGFNYCMEHNKNIDWTIFARIDSQPIDTEQFIKEVDRW